MLSERVLQYLAATNAVDEVSEGRYVANNITRNLAEDQTDACIRHLYVYLTARLLGDVCDSTYTS